MSPPERPGANISDPRRCRGTFAIADSTDMAFPWRRHPLGNGFGRSDMRRTIISSVALCAIGAAAAPAHAQDAGSDIRCILVSNVFARIETDATRKQLPRHRPYTLPDA